MKISARSTPLHIYVARQAQNGTEIKVRFTAIASSRLPAGIPDLPDEITVPGLSSELCSNHSSW